MKKLLTMMVLLNLTGCTPDFNRDVEMWRSEGFPQKHLSYDYMLFLNQQEGYLFGTYATNRPRKETIEVYKTDDGGKKWRKISEKKGFYIVRHVCKCENSVFLTTSIENMGEKHYIYKFDIESENFLNSIETENFGGIWCNDNYLFTATGTSENKSMILKTDTNLQPIDSILVNAIGHGYAVFFGDDIYNITRIHTGKNNFFRVRNRRSQQIPLAVFPEAMVKQDDSHIVLMGGQPTKDGSDEMAPIEVFRYNVEDGKAERLHVFKNHTIMKDLKYNGKVMTALVGNMGSFFNRYDLAFSLDGGYTWDIIKLKEKSYTAPTALIDNVLYIMSGAGRIQKIVF